VFPLLTPFMFICCICAASIGMPKFPAPLAPAGAYPLVGKKPWNWPAGAALVGDEMVEALDIGAADVMLGPKGGALA